MVGRLGVTRGSLRAARFRFLVNTIAASALIPPRARHRLLRAAGIDLESCSLASGCFIGSRRLTVGQGSYVNQGCLFDNWAQITIGRNCSLAMRVTLVTSTHEQGSSDKRAGRRTSAPIRIEDGCWLGANVTVLPGVTVGAGCIVAAGAVVADDCAPNGLYGGVPARRLRDLH